MLDFSSCEAAGCVAFHNSVIPVSRFDPALVRAQSLIPLQSLPSANSTNALYSVGGAFSGTHFDTSSVPPANIGNFGGFIQIPHAGPSTRTATFRLYVDGKLIASRDVPFSVQ